LFQEAAGRGALTSLVSTRLVNRPQTADFAGEDGEGYRSAQGPA